MKIHTAVIVVALSALAAAQTPQAPVQLQHVDVTNMDSSVGPCDNFYQYVCAKMNAANPIPPDQVFWGVGGELQEWNNQVLRGILEKNQAASALAGLPTNRRSATSMRVAWIRRRKTRMTCRQFSRFWRASMECTISARSRRCWLRCTARLTGHGKATTTRRTAALFGMGSKPTITT